MMLQTYEIFVIRLGQILTSFHNFSVKARTERRNLTELN